MTEPPLTRIAARSKRQAMDWSLVLVSQGIETTIEQSPDDGAWGLVVAGHDSQRAFAALRLYRVENRGWAWRQPLPWPDQHFDWACLIWAGGLSLIHWLAGVDPRLEAAGIMDTARVISGQWWRLFTAVMLHANAAHLAENLSIGIVFLGLVMGRYGRGTGLLAAYLAGVAGNVISLSLNAKPFHGLGASGMVMGALGLLTAQSVSRDRHGKRSWKLLLITLAAGTMLFVLFGLSPNADIAAHLGGFISGVLLGTVLLPLPARFWRGRAANLLGGGLLIGLVASTWLLALRSAK